MKIQFGPSIYENYNLVPKLWKITNWSLEHIPNFLTRITYELWAELLYSYEILKLSIWSSNLTKITI